MATLDLGKIKQVWKGTYNNGTAYVVDDLVAYTDSGILSTYICVANSTGNAPSSSGTAHASWNYVSKGSVTGGFNSHQVFTIKPINNKGIGDLTFYCAAHVELKIA